VPEIDKSMPSYSFMWLIILLYWFSFHLVRYFFPSTKVSSLTSIQSSSVVKHNPIQDLLLLIPNNIHLFIIALCFTFFHTYGKSLTLFWHTLWLSSLYLVVYLIILFFVVKLFLWSIDLPEFGRSLVFYRKRTREILAHTLSVLACVLFFTSDPHHYGTITSICALGALLYTYLEFSLHNLNFVLKNLLIVFLYICTIEIFPALVLIKLLVSL